MYKIEFIIFVAFFYFHENSVPAGVDIRFQIGEAALKGIVIAIYVMRYEKQTTAQ